MTQVLTTIGYNVEGSEIGFFFRSRAINKLSISFRARNNRRHYSRNFFESFNGPLKFQKSYDSSNVNSTNVSSR